MIDGTPNRPLYFYQKDIIGNTANWLKQFYFRVWKTGWFQRDPFWGVCVGMRHWVLPSESNLVAGVRPECLMILPSSKNLKHVRVALGTALGAAWPPTALWCAQRPQDCEAQGGFVVQLPVAHPYPVDLWLTPLGEMCAGSMNSVSSCWILSDKVQSGCLERQRPCRRRCQDHCWGDACRPKASGVWEKEGKTQCNWLKIQFEMVWRSRSFGTCILWLRFQRPLEVNWKGFKAF